MKCLFCQKPARKDESVKPKDELVIGSICLAYMYVNA